MEGPSTTGSSSSGSVAAPRLASGSEYAAWAPLFVNWCKRQGVGSALTQEIKEWKQLSELVQQWERESAEALMADMLGGGAASSGSSSGDAKAIAAAAAAAAAVETKRAALKRLVSLSERVYAVLFDALPLPLRAQAPQPEGYAFGLWSWLQSKYQCVEADSIGVLWRQWGLLEMGVEETYDAYRARANKLHALLAAAKESVSPIHFADVMLGRLRPRYAPAALALRASDRLKDLSKVDWDEVAAFVNAHERVEQRSGDGEAAAEMQQALAVQDGRGSGRGGTRQQGHGGGGKTDMSRIRCYKCKRMGHYSNSCDGGRGDGETVNAANAAADEAHEEGLDDEGFGPEQFTFSALLAQRAEDQPSGAMDCAGVGGRVGEKTDAVPMKEKQQSAEMESAQQTDWPQDARSRSHCQQQQLNRALFEAMSGIAQRGAEQRATRGGGTPGAGRRSGGGLRGRGAARVEELKYDGVGKAGAKGGGGGVSGGRLEHLMPSWIKRDSQADAAARIHSKP